MTLEALDRVVAVARSVRGDYGPLADPAGAPELRSGEARTVAQLALRELFRIWGLDRDRYGSREWNPLGALIPPGARVVLKPNWVVDENQSGAGLDCLVTHASVIEAVLEYVQLAQPGPVVLGDAPLQRCDFAKLRRVCGLDDLVGRFRNRGLDIRISDFRRTLLSGEVRRENVRPAGDFAIVDLKEQSLLDEVSGSGKFRVTVYNPDLLEAAHSPGRHRYMIAREILDADVVINLPKLKSHKKACITGALKNLIGINGNKEFLPHHRLGSAAGGGDCYEGNWRLKREAEELLDWVNRRPPGAGPHLAQRLAGVLVRSAKALGADDNMEGSWYGNDTIWRTCLDLQRILRYGRADGTLGETPGRRVITITDAIVAGEGEGPLAPTPVDSAFVTGALNPAAAEWIHARLMGFDPKKIPLVARSFDAFSYPLSGFGAEEIVVRLADGERTATGIGPAVGRSFVAPGGWQRHCELDFENDHTNRKPSLVA